MSDWDAQSDPPPASDEPPASRLGLTLFGLYTSVYAGFVVVSAFRPGWMARTVAGVNIAVLAGFGLILGAIALAALYLWLRRPTSGRA